MPGRDHAAEELPLLRDHVEVRGGAEVDDDRRAAETAERGERVHDAVGADLARVVGEDRDAGLRARPDDDGRRTGGSGRPSRGARWSRPAPPSATHEPGDLATQNDRSALLEEARTACSASSSAVRSAWVGQTPGVRELGAVGRRPRTISVLPTSRRAAWSPSRRILGGRRSGQRGRQQVVDEPRRREPGRDQARAGRSIVVDGLEGLLVDHGRVVEPCERRGADLAGHRPRRARAASRSPARAQLGGLGQREEQAARLLRAPRGAR